MEILKGFSALSRENKIDLLKALYCDKQLFDILESSRHKNPVIRNIIEDLSENVLSSFHLPLSIAPNFIINNKLYHVPMVTEESSVVAAASSAAKIWAERGGFNCKVLSTVKKGQIHFIWYYGMEILEKNWEKIEINLKRVVEKETEQMEKRGGGLTFIKLVDQTSTLNDYFQVDISFETVNAMGANFINSCLEKIAVEFKRQVHTLTGNEPDIIMSVLSNYTPECIVTCTLECTHQDLDKLDGETNYVNFIKRFEKAIQIANVDISRAVTHNKGIMNGIDAVLLATGNDFRAVEAGIHAYAARNGNYRGLTEIDTSNGKFTYKLIVPLSVGVVGGVTSLHPQVKWVIEMLDYPTAKILMKIIASAGMANNFSAIKSLVTKGIQKGHMKMHLKNILNKLSVTNKERIKVEEYFNDKDINITAVEKFIREQD